MLKSKNVNLRLKKGQSIWVGGNKYTVWSSNDSYTQASLDAEKGRNWRGNSQTVYVIENRLVKKRNPKKEKIIIAKDLM